MTTDVVETIRQLQFLGRSLTSDGEQLTVGAGGEIGQALAEAMRQHRDELIRIFKPSEATAERAAIQWAERQPNPEADTALASAAADWRVAEASAFVTAAAKAFPGSRVRSLSQAEYDGFGFPDSQAKQAAEPAWQPKARAGEWHELAFDIELRINGTPTSIRAGEGVRLIADFDEIADAFARNGIKQDAEANAKRGAGLVAVWVRGTHPTFLEAKTIGLPQPPQPETT